MLAMDRSIPHVRDIFAPYRGSGNNKNKAESRKTEVCVYDYSPGSRRRNAQPKEDSCSSTNSSFSRDDLSTSSSPNDFIDTDHSDSTDTENQTKNDHIRPNRSPDHRSSSRSESRHSSKKGGANNRAGVLDSRNQFNTQQGNRNEGHRNRSASVERDGPGYSSKTLTDRDIKHLERHLSMKKTIRKQISRNLAQAFVEDPTVLETDTVQTVPTNNDKNSNYSFTLTRAKVAKSEPTFLDMLKDPRKETDSGHSSPSHQINYEDQVVERMEIDHFEDEDENQPTRVDVRGYEQIPVPDYPTSDNRNKNLHNKEPNPTPDHLKKGASFWKKFGFKGKAKR